MYEARVLSLQSSIKDCYNKILNDELIRTMKRNPISNEFIVDRVKEIYFEVVHNDRE